MPSKTILLTGCAGFIGFHTAKAILERGDKVIGIDNLNDYYDVNLKLARLEILKKYPNFIFYKLDIEKPIEIKEKIDTICHLAAIAGVRHSLSNPAAYELTNNLGTLNVFEFARHNNIKNIVFASSSSVYGNTKEFPFNENQKLDTPISFYAATKKANELYAYAYHHLFGINMTGLRFFTVYGPYGRPDMALFIFTKAISEGKPINLYNNGNMKRDFTYVDDIVSGILTAIDKSYLFEIINLSGGRDVRLMEFVNEIEKNLNKKAIINFMPMQPGDIEESPSNISKAKKLLNYSPKISIEEGIKKFVNWYKEYYKIS